MKMKILKAMIEVAFAHTNDANETYFSVVSVLNRAEQAGEITEAQKFMLIESADILCEENL